MFLIRKIFFECGECVQYATISVDKDTADFVVPLNIFSCFVFNTYNNYY